MISHSELSAIFGLILTGRPFWLILICKDEPKCEIVVSLLYLCRFYGATRAVNHVQFIAILLVGLLLGPSALKIEFPHWLSVVSQIAGGFFLFLAGWEIKFLGLRRHTKLYSALFGGAFLLPFVAGLLFYPGKWFIAAAFGISALPVAIQILREKSRYDSELGRTAITLASLCDIAAWLLMFLIFPSDTAVSWFISHWFVFTFFLGLGFSRWRAIPTFALQTQKWILAPLFFVGLCWKISFFELFDFGVFAKILVIATLAKLTGAYVAARCMKRDHRSSCELALILNARGAMEIVAAQAAYSSGIINGAEFTALIGLGVVTSVLAIPLIRHRSKLEPQDRSSTLSAERWKRRWG